jgi:hypothetical protein
MSTRWSAPDRVVLDDHERVAEVAQSHQGLYQPPIVSLVQADRGLVQDVQDADEPATDLRRKADPLSLAARERR